RPSSESCAPTMAMMLTPNRRSCSSSGNSSSVAPLFEKRMATSDGPTMPRSPCTLSTGCRNMAGVPVDVSVAAILRPISPDLPTPATITRPVHAASNGAPRPCSICSSASRSMRKTRRPRSTMSISERRLERDFRARRKVKLERALPFAARAQEHLGEFAHGAASAGALQLQRAHLANDRHGIANGNGESYLAQDRHIGNVVAHEGGLLCRDAVSLEHAAQRRKLAC